MDMFKALCILLYLGNLFSNWWLWDNGQHDNKPIVFGVMAGNIFGWSIFLISVLMGVKSPFGVGFSFGCIVMVIPTGMYLCCTFNKIEQNNNAQQKRNLK